MINERDFSPEAIMYIEGMIDFEEFLERKEEKRKREMKKWMK